MEAIILPIVARPILLAAIIPISIYSSQRIDSRIIK